MSLIIHCADIGSVKKGNFGWARLETEESPAICSTGPDIKVFADRIADDINSGAKVAVGFECPLFLPVPDDPADLTRARPGEGNRPWSAGAGAGALATGLTETVWILQRVRQQTSSPIPVFAGWGQFCTATVGMFVWEAFVTKTADATNHQGDAEIAAKCFQDALPDPEKRNAVVCPGQVRSLIGAALLQTGWVSDRAWLTQSCIVIRA